MGARAILAPAALSLTGAMLLGLAACAPAVPVPVEQAERDCLYDALSARSPRTQIAIGIGSGGHAGVGVATEFSPDYLSGRTPSQAFDACVRRRSGQAPTTPLDHQRGWIG